MLRRAAIIGAGTLVAALAWAPAAGASDCGTRLDNFNRADSATLGSGWNDPFAGIGIEANAATNPAPTKALSTFRNRKAAQVCVDVVTGGATTQYVALVIGYANASSENIFVKVQDNNGDAAFDTAYFYRGNNGDDLVMDPAKPLAGFMSARMQVLWSGRRLRLEIDSNFDNRTDQRVGVSGFATAGLGTGIGLGVFGGATADNFSIALPQTTIASSRVKRAKRKARFRFASSLPAGGFRCKLDGGAFRTCGRSKTYRNLEPGGHTLRVRARDQVGNLDPTPAKLRFTI